MRTAKLEALGLEVPLGRFQSYTDHGYVEDPNAFYIEKDTPEFLKRLMGRKNFETYKCRIAQKAKPAGGLAWSYPILHAFMQAHICYKSYDNPFDNLMIRAHEETHALQGLGKLNFLERALEEEQEISIRFADIKDEEIQANIGGVYALCKKEDFNDVWYYARRWGWGSSFGKAFKIYWNKFVESCSKRNKANDSSRSETSEQPVLQVA